MYRHFVKTLIDRTLALLALLLLWPLLLILALLVAIKLGRPIFFKQVRPGLHGKVFTMYKFRSMTDAYDTDGKPLSDAKRLTRFGKMLRASSLDELPELLNIVKGDMSLVGPRPLLVEYLPLYSIEQARRHDVKPGLTGWAQVNGRNAISWQEKFKFDVYYVDNCTFFLDMKILFLTLQKIVQRDGISAVDGETMAHFTGNDDE